MQRRSFIRNTVLSAVAVSASGFIRFDSGRYVGDCETTSDILGPYYRPDSPLRNNLVIKGDAGTPVQLSGIIKHTDCTTPYKKAKIELWHCSSKGVYDNSSDEFRYRGTTYSDDNGHYSFKTILPVPYDGGGGNFRPAHFHLMITAAGYQALVTQLYFYGDPYIIKPDTSALPGAKRRILNVQTTNDGIKSVTYDVSMSQKLPADPAAIDKLTGSYIDKNGKSKNMEFFKKNNQLWLKMEPFGWNLEYAGNNTFLFPPGVPPGDSESFVFEIMNTGSVKLTSFVINEKGEKQMIDSLIKEK